MESKDITQGFNVTPFSNLTIWEVKSTCGQVNRRPQLKGEAFYNNATSNPAYKSLSSLFSAGNQTYGALHMLEVLPTEQQHQPCKLSVRAENCWSFINVSFKKAITSMRP